MNATRCSPAPFAVIGICVAFIFAAVWVIAVNADVSWVLGESSLGDLGASDVQLTADLYNYGLMLCGLLVLIFGLGKGYTEKRCSRASGLVLALTGIFMIVAGGVSQDVGNGNLHEVAAVLSFFFMAVAVIVSAFGDWAEGKKLNVAVTIVLFLITLWALAFETLEMAEVVATGCFLIWIIAESVKMMFNVAKA